jgi:hypothetical protein
VIPLEEIFAKIQVRGLVLFIDGSQEIARKASATSVTELYKHCASKTTITRNFVDAFWKISVKASASASAARVAVAAVAAVAASAAPVAAAAASAASAATEVTNANLTTNNPGKIPRQQRVNEPVLNSPRRHPEGKCFIAPHC